VFGNGAVFLCHHPAALRYLTAMPPEGVEEGFALALFVVQGAQYLDVFHLLGLINFLFIPQNNLVNVCLLVIC
jgi:hypothetical protein